MAIGCKKCGECCKYVSIDFNGEILPGSLTWLGLHGAKFNDDVDAILFPIRCRALTSNNECALYGSPGRPVLCAKCPTKTIKTKVPGCRFFED